MRKSYAMMTILTAGMLMAGCTGGDDSAYESVYLMDEQMDEVVVSNPGDRFDTVNDNPFVLTSEQPVSTFSVDADGASYGVMRRMLTEGLNVPVSSVRIEEYLNYFTFDYAAPTGSHTVAINAEVGPCPWNAEHQLLRLGIKGKELSDSEMPLANYVFLVDVSGSMSGSDRLVLLKSGLRRLLYQLNPDDRISLITYSGEVKKLLESTPVREASKIEDAIERLTANGCTAGGEAMKMAYEEAMANYDPKKNNRVMMGTDGDFNVGVTSTEELVEMVEGYAAKGIYLTCLGFGIGNLNDSMMEQISNKGNGTYHYIDSENEMMKVFVHECQRFVSVANDAKCQVTFNSSLVSAYRLIGYENRLLSNEDFEDDKKDAGEIGAGQTITALYEVVPAPKANATFSQPLATFDFRYKQSLGSSSLTLQREVKMGEMVGKNALTPDFYFAAGVAAYGMLLRDSPYKGDVTYELASSLVERGLAYDPNGYRAELLQLIKKMKKKQTE